MKTNLNDFREILILTDEKKNIVIFPISHYDGLYKEADGTTSNETFFPSYVPIEVLYPYSNIDLADKIQYGIEQWDKNHPCYHPDAKPTFEEKYYGIKGFKNAMKGKKMIDLGWNIYEGKYVGLSLPCKRGYTYLGIESIKLNNDADWIDFANAVIKLVNMDLTTSERFKAFKSKLNI